MSTWEERMAARHRARRAAEDADRAAAEAVQEAEEIARMYADPAGVDIYLGTCDVCGEPMPATIHVRGTFLGDWAVDDDGTVYTWRRHYATAPPGEDPRCAIYFSRIYRVTD